MNHFSQLKGIQGLRLARLVLIVGLILVSGLMASELHAQPRDKDLYDLAVAEHKATLRTLEQLVSIETGTGDAQGMAEMGQYLENALRALGATVARHPALAGVVGDHIVGTLKGKGTQRILLMAHMDTVYRRGTLAKAPFRVEGNRAYGPGIADAKGGVAVILHALQVLKLRRFDNYGEIKVMFNTDEELGSLGSRDLIQSLARNSDAVLSFEPNRSEGEMMLLGTSGAANIKVVIKGKAAHSGVNPEAGVNAMVEAADFMLRTLDLDKKEQSFRFNWTIGTGGKVHNVIPSEAMIEANVRYVKPEQLLDVMKTLEARAATPRLPGAKIELSLFMRRPAFVADAGSRRLIDKAIAIYKEVGPTMFLVPVTGGGTDAATAAVTGKPVVESLGLPGYGYHSDEAEYVLIDAIPRRLYLTSRMIIDIALGQ
jgi:glutamate carboxypeptidase